MRIAVVHAQITIGGASRRLVDLSNALAKEGHDVFFYLMVEDNYLGYEMHQSITVECISKKTKVPKTQWVSNVRSLRKKLKSDKIDLAISFLYPINIQLLLAKRGTKVKTLISERGDPNKQPERGIWKLLRDRTYHKTNGIVFQTQGAREYYLKELKLDGRVIHNPVDVGDVSAQPAGNKIISNIGLLEPHKNQYRLIYAFSIFVKNHPDYKLRICGGGYIEKNLKEYGNSLGLNDKIIWMGKIPEAHKAICNDDFFVLSSDYEGMPNALMEAMAMGMPCISTDCVPGGARELIVDGENGILCDLDNGESLAKKMSILAENPEFASKLGEKAAILSKTHSPNEIYKQWIEYITEIMERG